MLINHAKVLFKPRQTKLEFNYCMQASSFFGEIDLLILDTINNPNNDSV